MPKKGNAAKTIRGLTAKQELYVAARVAGMDRKVAYQEAFGVGHLSNPVRLAGVLEKRDKIARAIALGVAKKEQLDERIEQKVIEKASEQIAEKLVATRALIIDELLDNAMKCKQAVPVRIRGLLTGEWVANFPASNRAFELVGREIGMFKEGAPPDLFDSLSPEQVRALKLLLEAWRDAEGKGDGASNGNGNGASHGSTAAGAADVAAKPADGEKGRTLN